MVPWQTNRARTSGSLSFWKRTKVSFFLKPALGLCTNTNRNTFLYGSPQGKILFCWIQTAPWAKLQSWARDQTRQCFPGGKCTIILSYRAYVHRLYCPAVRDIIWIVIFFPGFFPGSVGTVPCGHGWDWESEWQYLMSFVRTTIPVLTPSCEATRLAPIGPFYRWRNWVCIQSHTASKWQELGFNPGRLTLASVCRHYATLQICISPWSASQAFSPAPRSNLLLFNLKQRWKQS